MTFAETLHPAKNTYLFLEKAVFLTKLVDLDLKLAHFVLLLQPALEGALSVLKKPLLALAQPLLLDLLLNHLQFSVDRVLSRSFRIHGALVVA